MGYFQQKMPLQQPAQAPQVQLPQMQAQMQAMQTQQAPLAQQPPMQTQQMQLPPGVLDQAARQYMQNGHVPGAWFQGHPLMDAIHSRATQLKAQQATQAAQAPQQSPGMQMGMQTQQAPNPSQQQRLQQFQAYPNAMSAYPGVMNSMRRQLNGDSYGR